MFLSPPSPLSGRNEKLSSSEGKKKKEMSHWPEGVAVHGTDTTESVLRGEAKLSPAEKKKETWTLLWANH